MGPNVRLLVLTLLVPCFFIVTIVFYALTSAKGNGALSEKYYSDILVATVPVVTFSIWCVIYVWQAIWIVYTIVNLFRWTDKGPCYTYPVLLPMPLLVSYLVNQVANVGWLLAFDGEILELALALLILMTSTLYVCLFFSYRSLDRGMYLLLKQERKVDVWLTRILVQNGLSIYATWCTIASLINLAFVLAYRSAYDIGETNASTISLGVLSGIIVLFLVTDWFFLDRYTRYTFTPYIVLFVTFIRTFRTEHGETIGILVNVIFTGIMVCVSGAAALVKLVLLFWRHCRRTEGGVNISDASNTEGGVHEIATVDSTDIT